MKAVVHFALVGLLLLGASDRAACDDDELARAKAEHARTIDKLDDALQEARRAHARGVASAHRTLMAAYDRAILRAVDRGDAKAVETLREAKEALAEGIPRPVETLDGEALFECVLGIYGHSRSTRGPRSRFVNLRPPAGDLWSEEIQKVLRDKISFYAIDYVGTAQLVIPEDGWYTIDIPGSGTHFLLNGRFMSAGDVELLAGVYDVEIATGTWGQPYLSAARAAVFHKETKERIPLVNTGEAIERFLQQRIADRPVVEVSGYQPQPVDFTAPGPVRGAKGAVDPGDSKAVETLPKAKQALTPPESRRGASDIDLLSLLDLSRDRLSGGWRLTKDGLWMEGGRRPKLVLPLNPRVDYELHVHFRMKSGQQFGLTLPVNPGMSLLWVSAAHKGSKDSLSVTRLDDARPYLRHETPSRSLIEGDKLMVIRVTSPGDQTVQVRVTLDDEIVLEWEGPKTDLATHKAYAMPTESIGLTNWGATVLFQKIQLRLLTPRMGE